MKHYIYTITIMLILGHNSFAQNNNKFDSFKQILLSENSQYFENASLKENGTLVIYANEAFCSLDQNAKNTVLQAVLKEWTGEMINIFAGYKREIWTKEPTTGKVLFSGLWDLNNPEIQKFLPKTIEKNVNPFFFYVGGQTYLNTENVSLFLNTRVGSFLYKNMWDLALSGTVGLNSSEEISTTSIDIGVSSKVYYPMEVKGYKISPYVGAGISHVFSNTSINSENDGGDSSNNYWNNYLLTGVSWYVGPGSFDLGLQFGKKNFALTIGYTFSL